MKNAKRYADEKGKSGYKIMTHDIPLYFTENNLKYIGIFNDYKLFGDPWLCGWANWPCWFYDVVKTLEAESNV